ncbi:Adm [Crotalus adamanteus]|uniref:Adm n=1 Tax=Crotalus adamanteus TaxID=8729 RepID=A0AAW1B4I0_CROAD
MGLTHQRYQIRIMDSRRVLLMLIWLTSCQFWRTSGMTDRQQSPPAASFLEQFLKIGGRVNGRATRESDLELEERPSTWAQLLQERDQLNLLRSIVPGHRMPRQLLASPPVRGCHLGTCQIQNLANLLYRYGGNNQKEESHKNNKGTNDPMGYGRRKRRAAGHGVSSPT